MKMYFSKALVRSFDPMFLQPHTDDFHETLIHIISSLHFETSSNVAMVMKDSEINFP